MAFVGLARPVIKPETGKGIVLGKAIGVDIEPQYSEASLYGDNKKAEYEKKFKSAKVTLETTSLPLAAHNSLFGHTVTEESEGEAATIISKSGDNANYVGFGIYTEECVDGKTKYVTAWLPKVKFADSSDSWETKGENINYKTPSIEGEALADEAGVWRELKVFDTEAEAVSYLNAQANIEE